MKTLTPMRAWMATASTEEQETLAEKVGTTRGMLYQYAGGHRQASAATAGTIERATTEMHKQSGKRLPIVYRTDLCEACRGCQYAAKCLGQRAVTSEFPIMAEPKA